jgi:hypothetical protein
VLFDPATIERRMKGVAIETSPDSGWAWPELDQVQEAAGGAPPAQRDALKLMAVFLQHTDNKAAQQRLVCAGGDEGEDGPCENPWMMVQDVGKTFGRANIFNRDAPGSVNYEQWSQVPIWIDKTGCVGDPRRRRAAAWKIRSSAMPAAGSWAICSSQLSDAQLRDLLRRRPLCAAQDRRGPMPPRPTSGSRPSRRSGIRSSTAAVPVVRRSAYAFALRGGRGQVASMPVARRREPSGGSGRLFRACGGAGQPLRVGAAPGARARGDSRRDSVSSICGSVG